MYRDPDTLHQLFVVAQCETWRAGKRPPVLLDRVCAGEQFNSQLLTRPYVVVHKG
jgi:hypothetical protein